MMKVMVMVVMIMMKVMVMVVMIMMKVEMNLVGKDICSHNSFCLCLLW